MWINGSARRIMNLVYIISWILALLKTILSPLWAKAFQKPTRVCSHLSSELENCTEDVPSAQRSLSAQCSWCLCLHPSGTRRAREWHWSPAQLVLGNSIRGACALFHLLKATTTVTMQKEQCICVDQNLEKNVGDLQGKAEVPVWRHRVIDTVIFPGKEWLVEVLENTPQ